MFEVDQDERRAFFAAEAYHGHADLIADLDGVAVPDLVKAAKHVAEHVLANCRSDEGQNSSTLNDTSTFTRVNVMIGVAREREVRLAPCGVEVQDYFSWNAGRERCVSDTDRW